MDPHDVLVKVTLRRAWNVGGRILHETPKDMGTRNNPLITREASVVIMETIIDQLLVKNKNAPTVKVGALFFLSAGDIRKNKIKKTPTNSSSAR